MPDVRLSTFTAVPGMHERERMLETPGWEPASVEPVQRADGTTVTIGVLDDLMREWEGRCESGAWGSPADSDRWLAPRVHHALRLTRVQASDKGVWLWVALRYPAYMSRRWGTPATEDRWTGGVNKQAFARLWWGSELFRDGSDLTPAVAAFVMQDVPNSLLHREVTRVRPFAVALARLVATPGGDAFTADRVNNLAGVANLVLAGVSPEAATSWWSDDPSTVRSWSSETPAVPASWDELPSGPDVPGVPADVLADADRLVRECDRLGPSFARAKGNRAGERVEAEARIMERMFE